MSYLEKATHQLLLKKNSHLYLFLNRFYNVFFSERRSAGALLRSEALREIGGMGGAPQKKNTTRLWYGVRRIDMINGALALEVRSSSKDVKCS